jgi:hypothetical protein|tara:strand:+ start:38 stop:547 length:510 start_codon:yes stop_codon:yes gene_type:complete
MRYTNRTEPILEAPIPGMAMTHEVGARPWQTPPQYPTVSKAAEYYVTSMQDESFVEQALNLMETGMPITLIANNIHLMSVMEGKHTIDVGMLLIPVIMEMLMLIGDKAGVEYTTGMERDKDIEIRDSASEAAFAKFQKQLGEDSTEEVAEEQEEDTKEEQPMGLMARRG